MGELRISAQINARYRIFDLSGRLPFSIVIGLLRRSTTDTDPRPLSLDVSGSALDVPYALRRGLLTLHERDKDGPNTTWVKVDLTRLAQVPPIPSEYISLTSPVNRSTPRLESYTVHRYEIDPQGELASCLIPGKTYRMRLAGEDLGIKHWMFDRGTESRNRDEKPVDVSEPTSIVARPSAGNADFRVKKCLNWPPDLDVRMRLPAQIQPDALSLVSSDVLLEFSITNTGCDSIVVQTQGHQTVINPWGPSLPESDTNDDRTRILHAAPNNPPTSCLQILDDITGMIVKDTMKRGVCGPLRSTLADNRPRGGDVVTLTPGTPVIRTVNIQKLLMGLRDGKYKIRMQPRGCWWWTGTSEDVLGDHGRVETRFCRNLVPPLMISSQDEVHFQVMNGKVTLNA